jgi:hypothetical protein
MNETEKAKNTSANERNQKVRVKKTGVETLGAISFLFKYID